MEPIQINCDMGESFGVYAYGADEVMMPYITSANIACGFHAGDPATIRKTVALAIEHDVAIGAHVGFPDRLGFGRRELQIHPDDAYDYTLYQLGALAGFLQVMQTPMTHIKLHGAFYMMAAREETIARAVVKAVLAFNASLAVYTLPNSALAVAAQHAGAKVVREFFADRPYTASGVKMFGWTPEEIGQPDDCAKRVLHVVESGRLPLTKHEALTIQADSICIHSDTPGAPTIARAVHEALTHRGYACHNAVM